MKKHGSLIAALLSVLAVVIWVSLQVAHAQIPGGGSNLTIGSTPISGGTNGDCLQVNGAVLGQGTCGSGSGTVTSIAPGCGASTSPNPITTTGTLRSNLPSNNVSAGAFPYTIQSSDCGTNVVIPSGGGAVTVPTTGTAGFGSGFYSCIVNEDASSHTVTFNSNVSGVASISLAAATATTVAQICYQSDGTVYHFTAGSGGGGASGANPTAKVGATATNGSASTFMRSDAAPALGPTTCTSFTPTDQSGASLTFTAVSVQYCQYANLVFVYGTLTYPATADGSEAAISLPVAVPNQNYAQTPGPIIGFNNIEIGAIKNTSTAKFYQTVANIGSGGGRTNAQCAGTTINFFLIYPAS